MSHDVFYPDNGSYHGNPVVFIHGLMGNKRNFQGIAKALTRTGKQVVCFISNLPFMYIKFCDCLCIVDVPLNSH